MPLNIAMIGTGLIAENKLLPAINAADGAQLWSVLSRSKSRAQEIATKFGAAAPNPAHDSLKDVLADPDLHAVVIATPDKLHAEQAMAAARAGKHVFVEKPMATSEEDAHAMVKASAEAGVKLGIAYHMRWHGAHRHLHKAVTAGQLGTLRHMRVQLSFRAEDDSNWRAGQDVGKWWSLAAIGTHGLDQILWFMTPSCGAVAEVKAVTSNGVWGGPHDETAILALTFENGATAELCSSVTFDAPNRFELYGTETYAVGVDTLGMTGSGTMRTGDGAFTYEPVDCYRAEIDDFTAAVENNRAPEVDGEMGALNVEILCTATQ